MMKKILKILGWAALLIALTVIGITVDISWGKHLSKNDNVSGLVSISQENLGYSVSTTAMTAPTSSPLLVAPARTVRYYGAVFNNSTTTFYVYLGPTSTPISLGSPTTTQSAFTGVGIPIPANGSYTLSQGNGNLYFGAVSIPTSTTGGSLIWVESFRP